MRCEACEFENREGRKFCASCGFALPVVCPECGSANQASARYCGGCGRPLADAGGPPSEPGRSASPAGDRRPVTVLFCDLVGYTRLSSQLDPEDVHALLERFFTLVDAIVDRFGGTIDKHIGDAAMALFGAPVAHGNDAERAVRAALEIQASLPGLNSGSATPLAAHIGVAMGEVVASSVGGERHRGYTVTGEAANLAARLLARATSGETLVSDAVYRATAHVVAYVPVGAMTLKGLARPVEVWRPSGTKLATADVRGLVGRRSEVAQFRAVLDACVAGASGAVILIRGEAGIGKTRLMDELQSTAVASGMATHPGFVLDFGTERGHGAVRTVIGGLIGLGAGGSSDAVESTIDKTLRDFGLQQDDALYLRDLLEVPQPEFELAPFMARWMRRPGRSRNHGGRRPRRSRAGRASLSPRQPPFRSRRGVRLPRRARTRARRRPADRLAGMAGPGAQRTGRREIHGLPDGHRVAPFHRLRRALRGARPAAHRGGRTA